MDGTNSTIILVIFIVIMYYLYTQGILAKWAQAAAQAAQPVQPVQPVPPPPQPIVNPHQYLWVFGNASKTEIGRTSVVAGGRSQTIITMTKGASYVTCGVTNLQTNETGWTGWVGYSGGNTFRIMLDPATKSYAHGLLFSNFDTSGGPTPPKILAATYML